LNIIALLLAVGSSVVMNLPCKQLPIGVAPAWEMHLILLTHSFEEEVFVNWTFPQGHKLDVCTSESGNHLIS